MGMLAGCCTFSAPAYNGPTPANSDGERFVNQDPIEENRFYDFVDWQLTARPGAWPEWIDAQPGPAPPERVGAGQLRVTFVNHATTLIQMDGLNILTDPVWSQRTSPIGWLGPERHRPPGIRFEDLPPIDVVVISHNHYDHLDVSTIERLVEAHSPRFIVPLGNSKLLRRHGVIDTGDLNWWQRVPVSDAVRVTLVPARHFSGRGMCDRRQTLWGGYVIEGSDGYVYFAGDTGWGRHFEQIRDRYGPPRLAILPIGAFMPRWFMQTVHISPSEAVRAHEVLQAEYSVPMHYGTFQLADDGYRVPRQFLGEALGTIDADRASRFWVLREGEGRSVP